MGLVGIGVAEARYMIFFSSSFKVCFNTANAICALSSQGSMWLLLTLVLPLYRFIDLRAWAFNAPTVARNEEIYQLVGNQD